MPYCKKSDSKNRLNRYKEDQKAEKFNMAKRKQFKNTSLKSYSADYDPVLAKRREKEKARRKANARRMKRGG